uniref:Uncharacterized protein n=1 Tax=Tanacetum cinerariifolium TaxID=118510 RepID=A0A6L2LB84_TANCI|nr:hypothetical protein [Tanacetum cinerariifolium]
MQAFARHLASGSQKTRQSQRQQAACHSSPSASQAAPSASPRRTKKTTARITTTNRHGPNDAMHNPYLATQSLSTDSCFISYEDYMYFYRLSHSELVGIEKVAVCSSLRSLKPKCTIESRAKRSSKNLIRTLIHYELVSHTL